MKRFLLLSIFVLGAFWALRRGLAAPVVCSPGMSVSVVPALQRVSRTEVVQGRPQIELWAARGETEAAQIIIHACDMSIPQASVSVTSLRSRNGTTIERNAVTLYRERYVYVSKASPGRAPGNRSLGKGWYADALIPFFDPDGKPVAAANPFPVPSNENQPVWIEVSVGRDTQSGRYEGEAMVSTPFGQTSIPMVVQVWNFELPLIPSLKSSFGMHEPLRSDPKAKELLLSHKVMPTDVTPVEASDFMRRYGLNAAAVRVGGEADQITCSMPAPPTVSEIASKVAAYPHDLFLYLYPADEIDRCPNIFPTVREWARVLHMSSPSARMLITVMPTAALLDDASGSGRSAVDVWVLLPSMYEKAADQVAVARGKGDEIWSYTALVQDDYSPKWEIDYDPIGYRIHPGFLSASLGLTGLLYWRVDFWGSQPWESVGAYKEDGQVFPGEGMLIYPGEPVGYPTALPSMRLKYIREGIEDYEYVQLASRFAGPSKALEISRSVASDWKNWTRDLGRLEQARRQLGDLIEAHFNLVQSSARSGASGTR